METSRRNTRRYGVSCLICRRKKVRCGGEKPTCLNCEKAGVSCQYKAPDVVPGKIYGELQKSQARVQELEDTLRQLAILSHDERDRLLIQITEGLSPGSDTSPNESLRTQTASERDSSHAHASVAVGKEGLEQAELSIDEHGEVQYFGATSRFHQDLESPVAKVDANGASSHDSIDEEYHRRWLLSNARFRPSWERQAHTKLGRDPDIDADAAAELLQIYWTWQGPLHNCVYRPCKSCAFRPLPVLTRRPRLLPRHGP